MRCILVSLLFWYSYACFAASPGTDQFIVDGVPHDVQSRPLDTLYPADTLWQRLSGKPSCAAAQPGYRAEWELKAQQLYLNRLLQHGCDSAQASLDPQLLFSETSYPLKAQWFSGAITVPLSDKDYKYCLTDTGANETIGYAYLAMVYEFVAGQLVKQSEQMVTENWRRPRSNCAKVPTARV